MNFVKSFFFVTLFFSNSLIAENYTLKNKIYEVNFNKSGSITSFVVNGEKIEFRTDEKYMGPSFLIEGDTIKMKIKKQDVQIIEFVGESAKLQFSLAYFFQNQAFGIRATVKNKTTTHLPIDVLKLRLGINTEMDSYPHWNSVYFPTMMRCEKNFFWGYLQNPKGSLITVVSPNPIASWSNSYNHGGHRIFSTSIDLMHQLPLPERHPQNLHSLKPKEKKSWTVYFQTTNSLQDVKPIVSELSKAVILDAAQYTVAENETLSIQAIGKAKSMFIITPDDKKIAITAAPSISYTPANGVGKYKIIAVSTTGKVSEAIFSVRKPWSWYMEQARRNAIIQEQKGGSHTESWYGLFSMFIAEKYFPNKELRSKSIEKFNEVYPLMYNDDDSPKSVKLWGGHWDIIDRIQNSAVMASLLVDIYSTLQDTTYLVKAAKMCDFLIEKQDEKGAYRNEKTHYTSVIYIAKSILEVCEQEKLLANGNNVWQQRYDKHFSSAKKAIDELTSSRDNIETEGEMTYEDGMISCSYTQISLLATLTTDTVLRNRYVEAAEYLRKGHQSLSQLLIPDARMNGGSLRYFESQYDVLSYDNMMSSPHGWTAWRIYGLYYLYQLTGNALLLDQMYNALGSCVQLVDETTGELRWAFCVDPYLVGNPSLNDPKKKFTHDQMKGGNLLVKDTTFTGRENRGVRNSKPVGEQYISMISGWYKAKPDTWVTGYWEPDGGCCDNDVHEIFKCLEETALTNAFVMEQKNGTIKGYNCDIKITGNIIEITPYEKLVNNVHVNLQRNATIKVYFANENFKKDIKKGVMEWIVSKTK